MSDRTETEETVDGIIAEMRAGPIPRHRHDRELLHHYADRLEAAHKCETATAEKSSAVGDCAKLREALVYLIQNESTLFEANLTGGELELLHLITNKARAALAAPARNCDVGRDTLSAALEQVNKVYDILSRPCVVIEEARQGCREARGVLIPALAEPVKNCEVGNAKEQLARFIAFCKGQRLHSSGHADTCNPKCPCRDGGDVNLCALTWAQMPYEERKGDEP